VVCSSLVAEKIRSLAPQGTQIVVDDRRLDRSGIEMLRQRLGALQATDGAQRKATGRSAS
jgi:hypothetical protein